MKAQKGGERKKKKKTSTEKETELFSRSFFEAN